MPAKTPVTILAVAPKSRIPPSSIVKKIRKKEESAEKKNSDIAIHTHSPRGFKAELGSSI
ncbi:hypothetical protein D3C77_377820 [compost metagenome]